MGKTLKCDGCGRSIFIDPPQKEYYIKYRGKVYCSRYCFNKYVSERDETEVQEFNYFF